MNDRWQKTNMLVSFNYNYLLIAWENKNPVNFISCTIKKN